MAWITYEFLNIADLAWVNKNKERLGRTQDRLVPEIRRIVSRSPRLTAERRGTGSLPAFG